MTEEKDGREGWRDEMGGGVEMKEMEKRTREVKEEREVKRERE